jgi:hypothetical protein
VVWAAPIRLVGAIQAKLHGICEKLGVGFHADDDFVFVGHDNLIF